VDFIIYPNRKKFLTNKKPLKRGFLFYDVFIQIITINNINSKFTSQDIFRNSVFGYFN